MSKLKKYPTYLGYFFPWISFSIHFDKKWVGLHFGRFFRKLIWSPCFQFAFAHLHRQTHSSNTSQFLDLLFFNFNFSLSPPDGMSKITTLLKLSFSLTFMSCSRQGRANTRRLAFKQSEHIFFPKKSPQI
jgi:hypothetical protein